MHVLDTCKIYLCIVDEGFRQLAKDLTDNNLYIRCLEEEEPVRYACMCACWIHYHYLCVV